MPHKYKVEGVKEFNPNGFGGMVSRAAAIGKKEFDFEKGIETIATTEAPALVVDWERWQVVREILPMRYMEAPNNDKVPLLDSHSRFEVEQIKGSAKGFRVDGTQLLCTCFVSEAEQDVRQKIKEGHIDSVSIGYRTESEDTVEIPKGANVTVDGVAYKNDFEDGYPMVVRTWWKTHELSLVAIGADEAAKFKSIANDAQKKLIEKMNNQEKLLGEIMEQLKELNAPETPEYKKTISKRAIEEKLFTMKHELQLI
jgi:hypothetical protein